MNDVFVEYMVKKRMSAKDIALSIFLVVVALSLFVFCVFFAPMFLGEFAFLGAIVGVAVIYLAYYLVSSMNIEYEFIVTNGEIDVDKIIARKKRQRLVTANARVFEAFGDYNPLDHVDKTYTSRVFACVSEYAPAKFAVFTHVSLGKTLLVFTPDDRTVEALKKFIPLKAMQAFEE